MISRTRVILLLLMILAAPIVATFAQESASDCPGALPRRLMLREMGRVSLEVAMIAFAEPGQDSETLWPIPSGGEFEVVGGPVCIDGQEWWQVNYSDAGYGWLWEGVDDYALEPVLASGTETLENDGEPLTFQGLTVQVDPALANVITARDVPATGLYAPAHLSLTLRAYPDRLMTISTLWPEITVWSMDDLAAVTHEYLGGYCPPDAMVHEPIAALQTILAEQPDLSDRLELPFLWRCGAAEVLIAQADYLSSDTLEGIRYLTVLSQNGTLATNDSIIYHFDGITRNGEFWVGVTLPLDVSILPDHAADIPADEYERRMDADYREEVEALLNGEVEFSPSLEMLDALVTSIEVEPSPDGE